MFAEHLGIFRFAIVSFSYYVTNFEYARSL
jgi:hypothetical protein